MGKVVTNPKTLKAIKDIAKSYFERENLTFKDIIKGSQILRSFGIYDFEKL